mmetsp:Transcript_15640/g.19073  ORF Transcript_15640/g.19073 Transcript_15640/m.19073 type:complete len:275 (+) Transcript_15640:58-882(+)
MQNSKTIEFWNQHHDVETNQEWIINPSDDSLLQIIISLLDRISADQPCSALEIGCGTSELSKQIYEAMGGNCNFIVTDVSPNCIEVNRERDKEFIGKSNGSFDYKVLDAASSTDQSLKDTHFDVIIDKGCLDTFLFRSERRVQNSLLEIFLNRAHTWMTHYYLIVTPRPKIKILRDFQGFSNIERRVLSNNLADLEGEKNKEKRKKVFLFICSKNRDYRPGKDLAFVDFYQKDATNEIPSVCERCALSFEEFCEGLSPRGKENRRWLGHRRHCR